MSATASVTVAGVPGVEIAYDRLGAGPPLLLLHGIGHHRQAWDPVLDRLAEHRDVIALDFPAARDRDDLPPTGPPYAGSRHRRNRRPHPGPGTRAKAQLGNATFVTLPACGHVPMNDNPALVAQVILQAGSNS